MQVGRAVFNTDLTAFTAYNTTCNVQVGSAVFKIFSISSTYKRRAASPERHCLKPPDYFEIVPL